MRDAWREAFAREYARVSGETAEIDGPLGEMRQYYRIDFSRCGGPFATRAQIERITAWLRGRASRHPRRCGGRMQTMVRTGLEQLAVHVGANESICCTRQELLVRSQTRRMIDALLELVAAEDTKDLKPETERTQDDETL